MEPDLTSEGLVRALQNNDERVIVLDPEGSGVLDSTTGRRYKKSGDHTAGSLSVILKCWSGEPIRQTRAKNADFSHASFRPRPGRHYPRGVKRKMSNYNVVTTLSRRINSVIDPKPRRIRLT